MNRNPLKRQLLLLCLGFGALAAPAFTTSLEGAEECSREALMSYFPENFVSKTLEKFNVPQAQRAAIIKELAAKDKEVITTVEDKAGKMNPNPLRDPKRRQEAVKIFRDTLYELFAGVMQAHGISKKEEIQSMLDDVQQQKAKEFAKCMNAMPKDDQAPQAPQKDAPAIDPDKTVTRQPRTPNMSGGKQQVDMKKMNPVEIED